MDKGDFLHGGVTSIQNGVGSAVITPSNSTTYTNPVIRQLHVFGSGDVSVVGLDGVTCVWPFTASMSYPQVIPVACTKVNATGTTVTAAIIAVY